MDNTVKFALSDIQYYQNDDSVEFAIARLAVLSTKQNSHRLNITKEILKRDGVSVLGKWIIADYDGFDVTTHTDNVHIVGVVPHDAKIDFIDNDDGTVTMWVDAIISKLYATQVYELFKNKNFRNVSVEMTTKNNTEQVDGSISIDGFTIYAICILGQHVNGSCPDAHMEMVRFSADNAEMYYKSQMKCSSEKQETEVLRKLNAIYNKLNLKEETVNNEKTEESMAKLEEQEKDVVMEQPTEEAPKEEEKKLAEDAEKKDEEEKKVEDEKSAADEPKSDDKEDDDKEEESKKASDEEKKDEEDKLAKAEAHCAELEAKCAELETKLSELAKFKADTEEKEKMSIVNQTLAQVKESMDSEIYAKFEEKAKEQTLDTVNAWRNEVLANVATVLMSAKKDESHLRMGIEEDFKTPTSLWDRM